MTNDVSIQVANNLAMTREIVSSVETHGSLITASLKNELAKYGPVDGFDPVILLKILTNYFNGVAGSLRDSDITLAQERSDDPEFREKRDLSIASATKTISRVKSVLNESALLAYGLSSRTPDTPDAIINYGKKIIALIKEKPEIVNETPADGEDFVKVNTESMIMALTKGITGIEQSLSDVKREERVSQAALETRDAKTLEWKNTHLAIASIISGLYQLAGRADLADRIRPTVRKTSNGEPATEPVLETKA